MNDLESVVKCVQRAIDQAELMADCQISSVYLALSGKHISCQNEIGMVPISEEEVTQEDVETSSIPRNRCVCAMSIVCCM